MITDTEMLSYLRDTCGIQDENTALLVLQYAEQYYNEVNSKEKDRKRITKPSK